MTRPDPRRKSTRTRRRGRRWDESRGHGWEPHRPGVLVTCSRHRIADAVLDPSGSGALWVSGPGLPATGERGRSLGTPLRVGCPDHGTHELDRARLAELVALAAGRSGRRRVPVEQVESPVN